MSHSYWQRGERRHSSLGYVRPAVHEEQLQVAA